jgi:hypothetical protein
MSMRFSRVTMILFPAPYNSVRYVEMMNTGKSPSHWSQARSEK